MKINASKTHLPIILLLVASQITSNPFKVLSAKKLEHYECNMEFKKTFLNLDYTNLEKRPWESSKEIKEHCPRIQNTCCSNQEVEELFESLKPPLRNLTKYYMSVRRELEVMKRINVEAIQNYYVEVNQKDSNGRCNIEKDDYIFNPFYIQSEIQSMLKKLDKLVKNIVKFYGGFACTMCDANDLTSITLNLQTRKMNVKINANICRQLFKFSLDQYAITELAITSYKLTKALTCREKENAKIDSLIKNFSEKMNVYRKTLKFCRVKKTQSNFIVPECKCQNLCKKLFNFKEWIDYYSILGLVTYNRAVFEDFEKQYAKGNLKEIQLTDQQNFIEHFIGDEFTENRFQIFFAQAKSIYGESEFEVELDNIDGVNPFDHNPKITFKDQKLIF
jgi:hypothetical protein